jgi:hypothetical protein
MYGCSLREAHHGLDEDDDLSVLVGCVDHIRASCIMVLGVHPVLQVHVGVSSFKLGFFRWVFFLVVGECVV